MKLPCDQNCLKVTKLNFENNHQQTIPLEKMMLLKYPIFTSWQKTEK